MGDGIRISAFDPDIPTVDTIVRHNGVHRAGGDGFAVATDGEGVVRGTLLLGNLGIRSGDDGIDVDSPATTITRNTANHNHDLGIEAIPRVIDGGGNKASGNENPLECINVLCK